MNNVKKKRLAANLIFVLLLFGTLLYNVWNNFALFAENVGNELVNYTILSYLVEVYEADGNYQHMDSILSPKDHEKNANSIKRILNEYGIDVEKIDLEYIKEFKEVINHSHFDIGIYKDGRLVNLKQSSGTSEKAIYIVFMCVSNELLQDSNKYVNYDEHINKINSEVKTVTNITVSIVLILIIAYYLYKIIVDKKRLKLNAMDIMVMICIISVLVFTIWRFTSISAELIYYSAFFEGARGVNLKQTNELVLTYEVYFKFLLYFLRSYLYEFATCFILMITLGEFAYARSAFKNEALIIANLFIEAIEADN